LTKVTWIAGSKMSKNLDTINSVLSQIRKSGLYGALNTDLNLPDLFVLRYLLDQPNDIVNLQKDIEDLPFFPDRLTASYQDEWIIFCKKKVSKLGLKELSQTDLAFLADELNNNNTSDMPNNENQKEETLIKLKERLLYMRINDNFGKQLEQLCLVQRILVSKGVAILKSEQQRKIERFIK
jgi:hypothetical protein